jgi:hypothetical protein
MSSCVIIGPPQELKSPRLDAEERSSRSWLATKWVTAMINALSTTSTPSSITSPPSIEQVFKSADNGNKGYLDQSDVESAIVKLSPQGMKLSKEDATALAKGAFSAADKDQDGKVTLDEFKKSAGSQRRPAGPPGGARPPTSAASGAQGAGAGYGSSGGGSTNVKTYDAADSNQDGKVSEAERLTYANKQELQKTTGTTQG